MDISARQPNANLLRGGGWPEGVTSLDQIIEDHINRPVAISCGFLDRHQIGSSLSGGGRRKVRVSRTSNNVIRAPEQVSSVLMLPITSVLLIRGDPERDILNDEHLHIHVTSVEHNLGYADINAEVRYEQVQQAVTRLGILLSQEIPQELFDSIVLLLDVWGNPDLVRNGELRNRVSNLENQLASSYDEYTTNDDVVQFLTGEQSPANLPSMIQDDTPPSTADQVISSLSPPLPPAIEPAIQTEVPAWLVSESSNSSIRTSPSSSTGSTNSATSGGPTARPPGCLYLRVVVSVDDDGNPVNIYPMFKHGEFGEDGESNRSSTGNTDLPPRDILNNRLISGFCAVSGVFSDGSFSEREFSNRLVEEGFSIERGIGGQSEWHLFTGETNQERYAELLNAIETLENYSNENGVQCERRNILEQLDLHFNEE